MNIALLGYGKMGKEIEKLALSRGHEIVLKSDSSRPFTSEDLKLKKVDVAIEFTEPGSAVKNIFKCFEANIPVVTGTTGWYLRLPEVRSECLNSGQSLFYASNFSIGVNLFFHINKELARLMNDNPEYEPRLVEIHHTEKKDAPSGTALTLVEDMIDKLDEKESWTDDEKGNDSEIPVISERLPKVPGTHKITYESKDDFIQIEHVAKGRTGFAIGAVKAAEWLRKKKGVYTMSDMMGIS